MMLIKFSCLPIPVSPAFSRPALVETGKVFLSNLSTDASKDMLNEMFKKFGDIQSIYVSLADPPGFGFVTYQARKSAVEAAKALDGQWVARLSNIEGLVQDCGISSANALEILQSYTKPMMCYMDPAWLSRTNERNFGD